MSTIIDTPDGIAMYHYLAQLHACKLHLAALKQGWLYSRHSPIAHVRRTYGFTGSNASIVSQFEEVLHGPAPVAAMAARVEAVVQASAKSAPPA